MKIDSPTYPEADALTGAVLIGYRPTDADPEANETVRVPASLFGAVPFQLALSEDETYLHVYTTAGAYKGSLALVDLAQDDL